MSPRHLLSLLGAAAIAVTPAGAALAAGGPSTTTFHAVKQAYAYFDTLKPADQRLVVVVFKTDGPIQRRADGAIRARGALSHHPGSSISSVGPRRSHCYRFTVPLRNGRFDAAYGHDTGARAVAGSHHLLEVDAFSTTGGGQAKRTITLRDRRPTDRSGGTIGCR